ncbi:hypothetical protein ACFPOD_17590 [Nitratireductor kimnyeongensis]|uniref:DUF2946 domain-containing protein n=1 Tax=Nitratireductor kimnyeongensis TaxID=430679 RepID=A0ABW0TBX2_9HYPH|nr:hypothetical protein [Nitratireductor kimnyeongensis]QZZ37717.1 hypothetical protein KW403_19165 [Nitratireductor kimnyeongensis]
MKLMLDMLKDRLATGLIAGLLAYFLLMQGFASAFAQGAMAGSGGIPGFIICTPGGIGLAETDGTAPAPGTHDCCTTLCQAGCVASPALPDVHAGLDCTRNDAASIAGLPSARTFHPVALGFLAEARAPPSFSI